MPFFQRNINKGCGFLIWIDPVPKQRFKQDFSELFRKIEHIEDEVQTLKKLVDKKDEEMEIILIFIKLVKCGISIAVLLCFVVLFW